MRTEQCACGAVISLLWPTSSWTEQMLRHVRTEQHRRWATLAEADMRPATVYVPVKALHWAKVA